MKKRIVIFASGSGTNTQNLIQYFQQGEVAEVVLVLSNKKDAKVLERAKNLNVKSLHFVKDALFSENGVLKILQEVQPNLIVLAGFLLKFPEVILKEFPHKVINIHPALLPKYGGKGMYGRHVHEAVVANMERETGITVHYVNEHYDEGAVIFQKSVSLSEEDTPQTVAQKVQQLEYVHFPKVIEELLLNPKTHSATHSPPKHG
ncbi:phosphoribosylglycinamide formyltransferase [Altibacter sp.]|uniref:phosphoribosylglycinamide formyltransferase n=1 Tax=Altibacter sp. TaxID=2024823 RepID=UPI000C8CD54A|nr:phosphoribosylglycinamide formyltransferase [Altibacter sp.]MAP55745.1 phosphoribosylglycinamide formyltransferase [Altibacter sp.]